MGDGRPRGRQRRAALALHAADPWESDSCHLRHWRLEGSEDGQQWTALRSHANDSALTGANGTASWAVEGAARAFRYLRVLQTGKNSNDQDYLCVNGLEVYGVVEQQ